MNAPSSSIRRTLKASLLGNLLVAVRRFFQKYFSEVGYVTRRFNLFFYQWRHKDDCSKRQELARKVVIHQGSLEDRLLEGMKNQGFSKSSLRELEVDPGTFIDFCKRLAEPYQGLSYHDIRELQAGAAKDYWLNVYDEKDDLNDPFHQLALHPKVLRIVSQYMREVPYLMSARFYYTPPYPDEARASMLWHYDNPNERIVKLFINPFEMTYENGPTTALPKKYDHNYYGNFPNYFDNQQAEQFGIELRDQIQLTGEPGTVHFVDTSKCFHKGAQAPKGRFVVIITYFSSQYYLFPKNISHPLEKCNRRLLDVINSA